MSERQAGWWGAAAVCALLGALLLGARAEECVAGSAQIISQACQKTTLSPGDDVEIDEDSDSAPFMIVVEHDDGWRCAASLVSLRTGVTSARCARGKAALMPHRLFSETPPHEIWALAAAQLSRASPSPDKLQVARSLPAATARRVARIALAGDRRRGVDPLADDLAVLELESPFGAAARARPILMATSRTECERETACNAVRAVAGGGTHRARFRVVDVSVTSEAHCAVRVTHWADVRDRAFCIAGEELCPTDRGTGVVCGGKLCGVLSDSVTEDAQRSDGCGDTHVAMSLARWRPFLHCAHTLRACGRGDCEALCSEHRLLNGDSTTESERLDIQSSLTDGTSSAAIDSHIRSSSIASLFSYSIADPMTGVGNLDSRFPTRSALEFEPNRPDFKAGEYGDNAAEYEEPIPSTRRRVNSVTRSMPRIMNSATRTHPTALPSHSMAPPESLQSTSSAHLHVTSCCLYQLLLLVNYIYIT